MVSRLSRMVSRLSREMVFRLSRGNISTCRGSGNSIICRAGTALFVVPSPRRLPESVISVLEVAAVISVLAMTAARLVFAISPVISVLAVAAGTALFVVPSPRRLPESGEASSQGTSEETSGLDTAITMIREAPEQENINKEEKESLEEMEINLHNQRVRASARTDHAAFLKEKDGLSQRMNDCLMVTPSAMAEQLAEQRRSLLGQCQKEMTGQEKETRLRALEEELTREAETFLETYRRGRWFPFS
ncbi:unnamed protein product [Natator depressus]